MARLIKPIRYATSPAGRKALRDAFDLARSDEGRKLANDAKKWATGPQGRKVADYGVWAATTTTGAVKSVGKTDSLVRLRATLAKLK